MNHQLFGNFDESVVIAKEKGEDAAQPSLGEEVQKDDSSKNKGRLGADVDSASGVFKEGVDSTTTKKTKEDPLQRKKDEDGEDCKIGHNDDDDVMKTANVVDGDVIVIVDDDKDDEKEDAEVKRRKLRKMVARSGGYPSFSLLLSANYDNSDDETPDDNFVPIPTILSSQQQPQQPQQQHPQQQPQQQQQGRKTRRKPLYIDVDEELGLKPKKRRREHEEDSKPTPGQSQQQSLSAADEGWYEGIIDMSMPEDEEYLSDLHQWIRQQLEFFSATHQDTMALQAGRRTPTVQGKVGLRCKHCARVSPPTTGSVSYPHNLGGIYAASSQKPQLHFEQHCLNLPSEERERMKLLLADTSTKRVSGRQRSSFVEGKSVPTSLYYLVSAKRLGLTEVEDGLRFGRDLTLEPLPFETIRLQVESETIPASPNKSTLTPEPVVSVTSDPRITADEESEQVLAEAIMEKDDTTKPSRRSDKDQITDYWFLTIRQMAICHAVQADFAGKGKKTKSMRIGFAGFCCRHCLETDVMPLGSCRSFSSAPDNLSSSISNSFAVHLQKCHKVPVRIKKALLCYKRLHQRQLAQLPYGSQRRLIHDLWARLRAADVSEEEMNERMKRLLPPSDLAIRTIEMSPANSTEGASAAEDQSVESVAVCRLSIASIPQGRPESFPECKDVETIAVLQKAMNNWDPVENDSLLLPEERCLISDYLFLVMRQLKVAYATASDCSSGRRPSVLATAGVRCMHCIDKGQNIMPSGRSFPSAPDNFASSMNSSLYGHMQACAYVPTPVKHALANLRKIHSLQCSSLKFGSQRRFFNLLHERLKKMKQPCVTLDVPPREIQGSGTTVVPKPQGSYTSHGFLDISIGFTPLFVCIQCRMVPLQFRSIGSCFNTTPSMDQMRDHSSACSCDSFNLEAVADVLNMFLVEHESIDVFNSKSFARLISACVGGVPELEYMFLKGVEQILAAKNSNEKELHSTSILARSKGLWSKFPESVAQTEVLECFRIFASEHQLSLQLQDHPHLLKYVLLIAPGLTLP